MLTFLGIKDATGDLNRVQEFKSKCDPDFLVYSGEDDSGCDFVHLGGDGVISVTANVAPKLMSQMLLLAKEGSLTHSPTHTVNYSFNRPKDVIIKKRKCSQRVLMAS